MLYPHSQRATGSLGERWVALGSYEFSFELKHHMIVMSRSKTDSLPVIQKQQGIGSFVISSSALGFLASLEEFDIEIAIDLPPGSWRRFFVLVDDVECYHLGTSMQLMLSFYMSLTMGHPQFMEFCVGNMMINR